MPVYTFTNVFSIDLPNDQLAQRVSDETLTKGIFGLRFVTTDDVKFQRSLVVETDGGRVVQDITAEMLARLVK